MQLAFAHDPALFCRRTSVDEQIAPPGRDIEEEASAFAAGREGAWALTPRGVAWLKQYREQALRQLIIGDRLRGRPRRPI